MGTILRPFLITFLWILLAAAAFAAGPVETSIFAVQGVDVDVTDSDATLAKNKALVDVQVKAFKILAERLGNAELVAAVSSYEPKKVLPYLRSLSIEEESISPGRYKGKLTVRFLPNKIRALYKDFGVRVGGEQGPTFLVLPIWKTPAGEQLWEDNPWKQAWINLRAEQSLVPVIVPLGDFDDTEMISVKDVLSEDVIKLEAIRKRYDVKQVIVAFAEAAEGGAVKASMNGDSPLGKLKFDKVYDGETGRVEDSASLAAQRFHSVMLDKYKSGHGNAGSETEAKPEAKARKSINLRVAFASPSEWNGLRSRILSTPGVTGLDVATLGADGALVTMSFFGTVDDVASSMQAGGLSLSRESGEWQISPF